MSIASSKRSRNDVKDDILDKTPTDLARRLFGNGVRVSETLGRDLDLTEGLNHTTTGIPYAIHGTATLVQQRVATALGNYQDPIKAVLPTAVHKDRTIVIRRKYVVGGQSIITPERAPARTVAIREDQRTVMLTRYGGDLEMNLNLFLRPEDAKEEFEMKLNAQVRMLEQTMVEIGYDTMLGEGTQLPVALARVNGTNDRAGYDAAQDMTANAVFGAMQKTRYPLQNLLAAAKMAGIFMPAVEGGYNTMILPAGLLEMERVTKRENMEWNLTGTSEANRKQVKVALENVFQDPRVPNMRILIHQPYPSFAQGAAYPSSNSQHGIGHLSRSETIGVFYNHNQGSEQTRYANHKTNSYVEKTGTYCTFARIRLNTASAIMAVSGSQTGELLYAYPSTGISTSQTTEAMKMQLRVYMGAVLYDPTRVLVLPSVHIEGLDTTENVTEYTEASSVTSAYEENVVDIGQICYGNGVVNDKSAYVANAGGTTKLPGALIDSLPGGVFSKYGDIKDSDAGAQAERRVHMYAPSHTLADDNVVINEEELARQGYPMRYYAGRIEKSFDKGPYQVIRENAGHLGPLDTPNNPRLRGQYVFHDKP